MAFWDNVKRFFGFDDEDEKKKRQQQSTPSRQVPQSEWQAPQKAPSAYSNAPRNQQQNRDPLDLTNPQLTNGVNMPFSLKTPNTAGGFPAGPKKAETPEDVKRRELDELTKSNYAEAKKQAEAGEGWFGRNILNKGAIERRAEVLARSRATNQYQEKHGWVKDPTVLEYTAQTSKKSDDNVEAARKSTERLNSFARGMDKVGEVAQWIPITGSVVNLGLAGAERQARSSGDTAYANDLKRTRDQIEFGMTQEQMDALDPETRDKLQLIRNVSYAASPLDFLGVGGLVKSGAGSGVKQGAKQLIKEGAVDAATRQAIKEYGKTAGKNIAKTTAVGTGITLGGQQYLTGEMDVPEAVKNGLMIAGTQQLFEGNSLKKAASNAVNDVDEVAPGIKSTNPNRAADATKQVQADVEAAAMRNQAAVDAQTAPRKAVAPAEDLDTPAYLRKADRQAAATADAAVTDARAAEMGVGPSALDEPAFQHRRNIQAVIDDGNQQLTDWINENPGATRQEIEAAQADVNTQVMDKIEELRAARVAQNAPEQVPAPAAAPVPEMPAAPEAPVTPAAAAVPEPAPVAPAPDVTPAPAAPLQPGDVVTPAPDGQLPAVPNVNPEQAPAAPRSHDALVRQMGDAGSEFKGKYSDRDVINLDELKQRAEGIVADLDDASLMQTFASADPNTMITNPQNFAVARAALDRLSQMDPKNDMVAQQVSNILDAMSRYESRSGQGLRVIQESFDDMPVPMKVRYLIKKIDAANANDPNYRSLADDPAQAAMVEANLTGRLVGSQEVANKIAATEAKIEGVAEAAKNGEPSDVNVKQLVNEMQADKRSLEANNGELVKYYETLVPGRSKAQKALVDFPKRMMLSSFAGRINDLLTTGANVANLQATNFTQGLLSIPVNALRRGTVTNTWKGGGLVKGAIEGARRTGARIFKGTDYVEGLEKALRGNEDLRSNLRKSRGVFGRTVQAATEAATEISQGVRDQRLYQLADQEAAKLGLKGQSRKQYAEARAAVPSRHMLDRANQLHMEVNNLNENPITRALNRVSAGIEGKSAIGGVLKNQIMPFTSWLGGNIWNTVTDKNVVANTVKFANSVRKGDPEGAVRNLAKGINGMAMAYAVGYAMTEAGLIVNEDAEGYNDAGAYFKIGDRYIPVTFLGHFAPNIILGNAAHNGLNAEDGSPAGNIAENVVTNLFKAVNAQGALGLETNLSRGVETMKRPGGSAGEGAAVVAGGAAGQFLPGFFGDANAVLNNYTSLNPTKEAAETKVTDPNSPSGEAKDVGRTELQKLKNRVPFLSQTLPRKENVAADDMIDRVTRGNRDTPGGAAAKEEARTKEEIQKDREERGVPMTEAAIETKFQNGDFDLAIEGIQAHMEEVDAKGELSKSDREKFETQIRRMETMRDQNISYEDWLQYDRMDLSDWRDLGDPESDTYNKELYEKLYAIDQAMTTAGASENSDDKSKNKFYAKKSKSGSGGGRGGSRKDPELARIQSNTVSSPDMLGKVSFGDLRPEKAGSAKIPTIQQIRSSDLVKKRKITVGKA